MFLWLVFYISELWILLIGYIETNARSRRALLTISALIAIYFSAFRNGLGTDYKEYLAKLQTSVDLDIESNIEPLFRIIGNIVIDTNLSPIFFFAICSIVTVYFIWNYLDNKNNKFAGLSIIIFLSLPGLYFNTFNVVRQYFSVAIFLYSLKYIQSKQVLFYLLCIAIASMMHTSAIILIPLYFALNKQFSIKVYILFIIALIVAAYSLDPILSTIELLSNRYSVYLITEEEARSSTITILCVLLLIIFWSKEKISNRKNATIESPYMTMTVNMFILYTVFSVLTFINFYFYRLTLYFGASVCVMMPYILYRIFNNKMSVTIVCLIFSFVYFFTFITTGQDNPDICPDEILPISSIFDR